MRQVCHRLLGAREETTEIQLARLRERLRERGLSAENGEQRGTREGRRVEFRPDRLCLGVFRYFSPVG